MYSCKTDYNISHTLCNSGVACNCVLYYYTQHCCSNLMRDDNNVINNIKCVAMLTNALFMIKKKQINKYKRSTGRRSEKSYKTWPIACIYLV